MNKSLPFPSCCDLLQVGKIASLIMAIVLLASLSVANAQQAFKTPEDGAAALVSAAKDAWPKGVTEVLGKGSAEIIASGDKVADEAARQKFIAAYDAKHQIARDGDAKAIMVIGDKDFPFPIPLVLKNGMWRFDTVTGRKEILSRRIGSNELDTIQACLAYVDAQNEYADKDRVGSGKGIYAQRIVSRPGKKDGLYWPNSQGGDESPLGEFFASAASGGSRIGGSRAPFHGYYFKILAEQGPAAPGGELNYVVRGKMFGGFALVAYPAQYRNSGVMTFIVNQAGTVFQKDLGPRTAHIAERMTVYNPDKTWKEVNSTALKN